MRVSTGIKGSKRPGAGRKKGVPNKRTQAAQAKAEKLGALPLDFMLEIMRDTKETPERRFEAAKAAAPYLHARLSATTVSGKEGKDLVPAIDPMDIARRIAFLLSQSAR